MTTALDATPMTKNAGWIETFARIGYAAKGVVYSIIGVLAVQMATGSGSQRSGPKAAFEEMTTKPFGEVLLVLVGLGLACYAIWRLVLAFVDPEHPADDAKGIIWRIGHAVSGLTNLAVGVLAFMIVFGSDGGSGKSMTAGLMAKPYGPWLFGFVGLIVVGVGLYHFYRAWSSRFMEKYNTGEMSATQITWAKRIGWVGLCARGVAFLLIGGFLIRAALQGDSSEAGGLGKAFETLLNQPYGPWLLGLVAVGFVCYGIYCFSYARYRHFKV